MIWDLCHWNYDGQIQKLLYGNAGYFNIDIFGQTAHLNGFASRRLSRKKSAIYFIYFWEVAHIFKEDGALYYI